MKESAKKNNEDKHPSEHLEKPRVGDVYFLKESADTDIRHPYVVFETENTDNPADARYRVCMISTNMKKAYWPGNILLRDREANLPKQSIAVVSKVLSVNMDRFEDYVGRMDEKRTGEIRDSANALENLVREKNGRQKGRSDGCADPE